MIRARYHISAWGSDVFDDIDGEFDAIPVDIHSQYPFVNVCLQVPISYKHITEDLYDISQRMH